LRDGRKRKRKDNAPLEARGEEAQSLQRKRREVRTKREERLRSPIVRAHPSLKSAKDGAPSSSYVCVTTESEPKSTVRNDCATKANPRNT